MNNSARLHSPLLNQSRPNKETAGYAVEADSVTVFEKGRAPQSVVLAVLVTQNAATVLVQVYSEVLSDFEMQNRPDRGITNGSTGAAGRAVSEINVDWPRPG